MSSAAALSSSRALSSGPASMARTPGISAASSVHGRLGLRAVAADQRVAVERMIELAPAPPHSTHETPPPPVLPAASRAACCAADPSHNVRSFARCVRRSRSSSGTVASTRIAPGAMLPRIDFRVSTCAESGTVRITMPASGNGVGIGMTGDIASNPPRGFLRLFRVARADAHAPRPPAQNERPARCLPLQFRPPPR